MILLIQVWLLLLVVLSGAKKHQERRVELDPLVAPSSPTSMIKTEKKRMEEVPCAEAKQNCALRRGCGNALHNFALGCAALRAGKTEHCSDHCQKSLIALTSTYEGQVLMKCKCETDFCEKSKSRIEVCRPDVLRATANATIVSCSIAQWICSADVLCGTALQYYHRLCKHMFTGRKCTAKCRNSIQVLRRQERARKLETCECDGTEDYDCPRIRRNMVQLCHVPLRGYEHLLTNVVHQSSSSSASSSGKKGLSLRSLVWLLFLVLSAVIENDS